MSVIFLDIDGVLNSAHNWPENNLEDRLITNLKTIIDETNAEIVLSSSWKNFFDENVNTTHKLGLELLRVFNEKGLTIKDITPYPASRYTSKRGLEIKTYIDSHDIDNYVVIDDDEFSDFKDTIDMTRFIKTESGTALTSANDEGLTEQLAQKAIEILTQKG
jgi:hypothetical protein